MTVGVNAAREYKPRSKRAVARTGTGRRAATGPGTRPMVGAVQESVPDHAREILADPAWPALRARLVEVEKAGDDPGDVLATVAARRDVNSADSITEVLVWRLDGWQRQRSSAAAASGSGMTAAPVGGPGRTHPGPQARGALAETTAAR